MKKLKNWLNGGKFLGKIGLLSVLILSVSMPACKFGPDDNKPGINPVIPVNPDDPGPFVALNVSAISEWDYLFVRKDGATVLMNVDDEDITQAKPTRLYYKPLKDSDVGIAMTCRENGLPELMAVNGHVFYFTNFTGYTYDMAVVKPNGDIEYQYGIETETDFDLVNGSDGRAVSGSRSAWNPLTWDAYDWGSFLLTFGSCAAGIFVPVPFAGLCVGGAISLGIGVVADAAIDILVLQGIISDEIGTVASSTISVIVDGLGCLELKPFDCTQAFIGVTHTLFATGFDFAGENEGLMEKQLRKAVEEIEASYDTVVLYRNLEANGTSESTTTKLTLTFSEYIPLLTADHISLKEYGTTRTGAAKGALTHKGNGVYELALSGITRSGEINVSVSNTIYKYDIITTTGSRVKVYAANKVLQFVSLEADGSEGPPAVGTSKLTLTLSDDGISSSALRDGVTLDAGTTGAAFKDYTWDRKWVDGPDGSRVRVPGAYVRDVTGITQTGEVKLTVSLPGYIITPPDWHTVTVYAGPTEPEEPEDPNVETFTSTADLKTWLQAQPDNTPATAYKVKLNLSSITGIRDALGNAAGTKFVRLDLSGSTITGLGNECFYGSYPGGTPALVGITMPSKSTGIGYYTFRDCANLASVSIPNGVTFIGERAFYGCTSLTSVNIPNSVTTIYNSAFNFCSNLASVTIPNSVTSIGDTAFQSCKNLASVTIGNGVTSIGDMAFENCTSLTSVTIPGSVTSIGASVFEDCTSLTSVTIRNGVTTIPWGNFNGCTSLTSVSIPDSVTSIGGNAFYGCTSLASVTIGNSVTTIGRFAFFGCTSLTSATIPASVTTIEEGAFWGCTSLTSVTFATGSNIPNFGSRAFPEGRNGDGGNDLRLRYSIDKAGTYTRSATGSTWGWR